MLGAALATGGCALWSPAKSIAPERRVPLSGLRRLNVVRSDPINGRCEYVADLGFRMVREPVLFARCGDVADLLIENFLPQPTTVHFHGLTLPESADGAGFDPIPPGGRKRLRFEVRNRAGLYWLHSHAHGFTAEQVHAGLAALLIVGDEEDDALDNALAIDPGNRLALVLADARISNGVLSPYAPRDAEYLHGWYGNHMRVNGQLDAVHGVSPGWVRLQLLNACNARGLLLGLEQIVEGKRSALPFYLLGTDGGLLRSPRLLERVFFHGAERLDIAIALAPGAQMQAVSLPFDPRHQIRGGTPVHAHPGRGSFPALAAADICSTAGLGESALADGARMPLFFLHARSTVVRDLPPMPSRLSGLEDAAVFSGTSARHVRLDFDEQRGFLIDNLPYRLGEAGYGVSRGTREIWEVRNSPISMPHAMHLHGFGFRVLRRQGTFGPARALATESNGRLPTDLGVKDTVLLWPNETLWLDVDFSLPANEAFRETQRYMFHCHNLEHEDAMMMRNVTLR